MKKKTKFTRNVAINVVFSKPVVDRYANERSIEYVKKEHSYDDDAFSAEWDDLNDAWKDMSETEFGII